MVPARLAKAHRSVKPVGPRGHSRGVDADGGRRGGEEPGCLGDGLLQPAGHRPRHDKGAVGEPVGVARRVGQVDGHRHGDVIGGTRSEIDVGPNTGRVQPFGSLRSDSFDPRQVVRPGDIRVSRHSHLLRRSRHHPAPLPGHPRRNHHRLGRHYRQDQPPRLLTRPPPCQPPRWHGRPLVGQAPAPLRIRLTQGPKYRCGNPR